MKKGIYSLSVRILAFLLAVICLPLAVGFTSVAIWNAKNGFAAESNPEKVISGQLQKLLQREMERIVWTELYYPGKAQNQLQYVNLRFTVVLDGVVLESTEEGTEPIAVTQSYHLTEMFLLENMQDIAAFVRNMPAVQTLYRWQSETEVYRIVPGDTATDAQKPSAAEKTAAGEEIPYQEGDLQMTVSVSLPENLQYGDVFYSAARWLRGILYGQAWLIPLAIVCYLIALLGLWVSFCVVGHAQKGTKAAPTRGCNMPWELPILVFGGAGALAVFGAITGWNAVENGLTQNPLRTELGLAIQAAVCLLAAEAFVLGGVLQLAVRFKCGIFWQGSLILRLLHWSDRTCKKLLQFGGATVRNLPMLGKTALWLAALWAANSVCIAVLAGKGFGWLFALHRILAAGLGITAAVWAVTGIRDLQSSIRNMAAGDLEIPVRTDRLRGPLQAMGEDLTHIQEGVNLQVRERIKSEQLKTELLANVTHDIKTPLTSIINYVDLMKKTQPQDETLCDYLAVLDRQSIRLKKLIEDLMEASKASSGTLSVQWEQCNLQVLLQQVMGEYTEKLKNAALIPVICLPQRELTVLADGRYLWRILDNLLNNICKYAQSGTRVYLHLQQQEGQAVFTFRNISREQLDISGEELTERFVRGDRSRHTEGNGLGLSIAHSLAELQGGSLQIAVDGDLFKAVLCFPLLEM